MPAPIEDVLGTSGEFSWPLAAAPNRTVASSSSSVGTWRLRPAENGFDLHFRSALGGCEPQPSDP
jgi:hypothetical protein